MKTLIAYYSFTGNNALLAGELSSRLDADIYAIKEKKLRSGLTILLDLLLDRKPRIDPPLLSLEQYDLVILSAPIWDAGIASPLKSFIGLVKPHLGQFAFVTLCGGRSGQQEKIEDQLTLLAGKAPLSVTQLPLSDLPPERMKLIKDGTSFRMEKSDMDTFRPALDELMKNLSQPQVLS